MRTRGDAGDSEPGVEDIRAMTAPEQMNPGPLMSAASVYALADVPSTMG